MLSVYWTEHDNHALFGLFTWDSICDVLIGWSCSVDRQPETLYGVDGKHRLARDSKWILTLSQSGRTISGRTHQRQHIYTQEIPDCTNLAVFYGGAKQAAEYILQDTFDTINVLGRTA